MCPTFSYPYTDRHQVQTLSRPGAVFITQRRTNGEAKRLVRVSPSYILTLLCSNCALPVRYLFS
jgi:hypothetical protein